MNIDMKTIKNKPLWHLSKRGQKGDCAVFGQVSVKNDFFTMLSKVPILAILDRLGLLKYQNVKLPNNKVLTLILDRWTSLFLLNNNNNKIIKKKRYIHTRKRVRFFTCPPVHKLKLKE